MRNATLKITVKCARDLMPDSRKRIGKLIDDAGFEVIREFEITPGLIEMILVPDLRIRVFECMRMPDVTVPPAAPDGRAEM